MRLTIGLLLVIAALLPMLGCSANERRVVQKVPPKLQARQQQHMRQLQQIEQRQAAAAARGHLPTEPQAGTPGGTAAR